MSLMICLNLHELNILLVLQSLSTPTHQRCSSRDKKVLLGTVVKEKVGELEDEVRELLSGI